jgi:dipeptidyl aminopeptidase/acylaminoacyl peptidase
VISALHFKQDEDGYLASGHDRHLYLLDVESGTLTALTQDPAYEDDLPAWSPDGRRIAFVRTSERGQDPDGRVQLTLLDAQPGASAQLLARPYAPNTQRLAFSPDGGYLAYLAGEEPRYNQYIQDHLLVVPTAGGKPRDLSATLDRAVTSYAYAPDGRSITALIEDDGVSYPAHIDLASGAITSLSHGPYVVAALTQAGDHSALLYAEEFRAMDVAALEEDGPRPLDAQNAQLFAQIQFATVQQIAFRSRDGAEVHGRIIRPPGFVPGRKYPAIVWIHGGPNSQDMHALDFDDNSFKWQLLAARGFIVLAVNYRGSSGRGSAYTKAIFADWGHKDLEDVLAGVDKLVALREVDPARLGIGGWSYGAILTDFAIAKDGRFKAAFSGAGTANPLAQYGSDEYIMQYNNELGPPWRDTALWLRLSYPLLHADKIHTPTLFMGGTLDFDVPISGGEQMYEALRTLGVPTQLVIYPGQYHTLTRPSFRKDRMERVTDWFTRYLDPAP